MKLPRVRFGWLGYVALFGGTLGGVWLVSGLEHSFGVGAHSWRALGVGGGLGGGLGWLALTSFRPLLGPRSAALRVVKLLLKRRDMRPGTLCTCAGLLAILIA